MVRVTPGTLSVFQFVLKKLPKQIMKTVCFCSVCRIVVKHHHMMLPEDFSVWSNNWCVSNFITMQAHAAGHFQHHGQQQANALQWAHVTTRGECEFILGAFRLFNPTLGIQQHKGHKKLGPVPFTNWPPLRLSQCQTIKCMRALWLILSMEWQ